MGDGRMSEFEGTVDKGDVVRVVVGEGFVGDLDVSEYFGAGLLRVHFEGF